MHRAHEMIMLNITWRDHKTAEWIREQTKLRDILETTSKAKWTWAGHLKRRTDNRWTTKLTFWQPRGHTRNKGRPKFWWRDDLDKFCKHWHWDASDRLRWRQMGKAYVQLRTFKGWPDPESQTQHWTQFIWLPRSYAFQWEITHNGRPLMHYKKSCVWYGQQNINWTKNVYQTQHLLLDLIKMEIFYRIMTFKLSAHVYWTLDLIGGKVNFRSLVLLYPHTFMCSPDECPRRAEMSYFWIKSLQLKCHMYIFLLFIYIYMNPLVTVTNRPPITDLFSSTYFI